MFERVALIGIGLIGSSISHAMRRKGLARSIVGTRSTKATLETALRLGLVDKGYASAAEAVRAPISSSCACRSARAGRLPRRSRRTCSHGAILTDVGSVKGAVVRDVGPHVPAGRALHSGPSDRRHRAVGPGGRLRRAVRRALVRC